MPQVPRYQPDQVKTTPLRVAHRQAPSAESFGAGFGETLSRIGVATVQEAGRIKDEEQRRANQLAVVTAKTQFDQIKQIWLHSQDKGVLQKVGLEPYALQAQYLERFDEQAGEIVKAASSPEQQIALESLRQEERASFLQTMSSHATQQYAKYEEQSYEDQRVSAKKLAVASATSPFALDPTGKPDYLNTVATQLRSLRHTVEQMAQRYGLSPETAQRLLEEDESEVHVGVVKTLLAQQADAQAKAYYQETKAYIDPKARPEIEEQIAADTREIAAFREANAEWAKLAPPETDETTPLPTTQVKRNLAATFKDDPAGYRQAALYVDALDAQEKERRRDLESTRLSTVSKAIEDAQARGVGLSTILGQIRGMDEFRRLTGVQQRQIAEGIRQDIAAIESRNAAAEGRAAAAEARVFQAENRERARREEESLERFNDLISSVRLDNMTEGQMELEARTLTPNLRRPLRNEWEARRDAKQRAMNPQLDNQIFQQEVFNTGIFPYAGQSEASLRPAQKAELGAIRAEWMQAIVAAQLPQEATATTPAKGVTILSEEGKRALLKDILSRKVTTAGWFGAQRLSLFIQKNEYGGAYVQYEQAKQDFPDMVQGLLNHLASMPQNAGTMVSQRPDETALLGRYRGQLERAIAAIYLKRTTEEVNAILEGRGR